MGIKSLNIVGQASSEEQSGISRRGFLKVLGGTAAAAAVGCADSAKQNIYPNVKGDVNQIPGVATWYNSTCTECDAGCGVMVRSVDGRVVKIEGNAQHPVNRGGLCAIGHSALQAHYDPDRIREPLEKFIDEQGKENFRPISWKSAFKKIDKALNKKGKKAFITGSLSGTLGDLLEEWTKKHSVEHQVYNPLDQVALASATQAVAGKNYYGIPDYDFSKAEVVVNFGADFLETWISPCGYARDWADSRKGDHPLRVFQVEPRLSLTGANADHWLNCKPGTEIEIALAMLKELMNKGHESYLSGAMKNQLTALLKDVSLDEAAKSSGVDADLLKLAVKKLHKAKSSLLVASGASVNAHKLQVVVALINRVLGNFGETINLEKLRQPSTDLAALKKVLKSMNNGDYTLCFVDGSNPSFTLPSESKFDYAVKKLDLLVSFSSHLDETSKQANLILPASTSLESWGDHSPYEGLHSLIQPVMEPIFDTKSLGDMLLTLDGSETDYYEYLRDAWKKQYAKVANGDFEKFWETSVERGGYFADSKTKASLGPVNISSLKSSEEIKLNKHKLDAANNLVLLPYPSIKTFDGRAANRPWMQEIPDPLTQVAWDTWAEINPETAKKLNVKTGDPLRVNNYYGELNIPAYVTENVHPEVIAVPIGNGHEEYGRYASSVGGGNVFDLLTTDSADHQGLALLSSVVSVKRGPGSYQMINTQAASDSQHDRHIARTREIPDAHHGDGHHDEHHGDGGHHGHHHEAPQMYEQREHPVYKWGMAIDLAACTGCSACVAACYAENNIPTVGKDIMLQGREMSWIKIDRYYDTGTKEAVSEELQVSFMPSMCQHCNNAPCEPVCPVYATYHNEEGMNVMVYNRCVGTRYCANNCVYKVRRFNWFEFDFPEPLDMQLNPDVMKRDAGVMEKCSFCVQRIVDAKDLAKDEGRIVDDGEVQPACVQSCPTQAMVFGNLNDPDSKVSKWSKAERSYKVLDHHLNTQPAVSYLDNLKYKA